MYKRILLAYNEVADRALQESIFLAKDQKAQLKVIYVIDAIHSPVGLEYVDMVSLKKEHNEIAKKLLVKVKTFLSDHKIEAESKIIELTEFTGSVADKINEEAEKWSADLVILGTKGKTGIKRLLLGSVAEGVIRVASGNYSLLLVKESQNLPPDSNTKETESSASNKTGVEKKSSKK